MRTEAEEFQAGSAASAAASADTSPSVAAEPRRPSPQTIRLYASDWNAFVKWCRVFGATPLPAEPAAIAAYLETLAGKRSHGALARRLAAIADQHRQNHLASPTRDAAVKAILRDARRVAAGGRKLSPRSTPVAAKVAGQLARMAAACPGDLAGLRDRALLRLAAAAELGRAALVGLDFEHVRFTESAVELTLPDGDTERCLSIPCGADPSACPVHALRHWLRMSDTKFGPVFRKIDRWGNLEHRRLGTDAIRRILAKRAKVLRAKARGMPAEVGPIPHRARRSQKATAI